MKNVAVIGTVGIPACYGGFESLVENLTSYSSNNVKYHVFCSSKTYPEKLTEYNGASLSYLPLRGSRDFPSKNDKVLWRPRRPWPPEGYYFSLTGKYPSIERISSS
ncbi:DUF1972 domain-containing protein, partial [Escherichia coli]|uniref:DUF1972 domain-containing protein n=1 Tax=Escherichia coli TaxID=562 RepID=UPI0022652D3B